MHHSFEILPIFVISYIMRIILDPKCKLDNTWTMIQCWPDGEVDFQHHSSSWLQYICKIHKRVSTLDWTVPSSLYHHLDLQVLDQIFHQLDEENNGYVTAQHLMAIIRWSKWWSFKTTSTSWIVPLLPPEQVTMMAMKMMTMTPRSLPDLPPPPSASPTWGQWVPPTSLHFPSSSSLLRYDICTFPLSLIPQLFWCPGRHPLYQHHRHLGENSPPLPPHK